MMPSPMRLALLACFTFGCSYHASFGDCEVSCTQATGCPDGFSCNAEGLCRVSGATATCNQVLDAPRDFPPPKVDMAPPGSTVLSQTTDDIIAIGHFRACMRVDNDNTFENSWYRVFPLRDFGIQSDFRVTTVKFAIEKSTAATDVRVNLGVYTGTLGLTLDTTKITPVATKVVTLPQISVGDIRDVPFDALMPPGANVIVEVFAPDYNMTNQTVALGTTQSAQTTPGFWRAPICEVPEPKTGNRDGDPNPAFIIEVVGTPD